MFYFTCNHSLTTENFADSAKAKAPNSNSS